MNINIHGQMQKNKMNTVLLFSIFIILIVAVVYAIALLLDPGAAYMFAAIALVITFIGSFFSYFYSDRVLLKMSGARPVSKEMEPHLYHTIEDVAVAAGIPTPKAYVIETDLPNAFATGRNPDNSAVAVTRGLMRMLNKEEMEGVIAHEMAHIKNYDILFTTIAIVFTGVLVFMGRFLSRMFFTGAGRGGGGRGGAGQLVILLVVGIITAVIAPLAAKMAQMAISRNREYLADATAADMLGHTRGLASALEKLGRSNDPVRAEQAGFANEANAGLFIVNPLAKNINAESFFSTHPPINKRVERLKNM